MGYGGGTCSFKWVQASQEGCPSLQFCFLHPQMYILLLTLCKKWEFPHKEFCAAGNNVLLWMHKGNFESCGLCNPKNWAQAKREGGFTYLLEAISHTFGCKALIYNYYFYLGYKPGTWLIYAPEAKLSSKCQMRANISLAIAIVPPTVWFSEQLHKLNNLWPSISFHSRHITQAAWTNCWNLYSILTLSPALLLKKSFAHTCHR